MSPTVLYYVRFVALYCAYCAKAGNEWGGGSSHAVVAVPHGDLQDAHVARCGRGAVGTTHGTIAGRARHRANSAASQAPTRPPARCRCGSSMEIIVSRSCVFVAQPDSEFPCIHRRGGGMPAPHGRVQVNTQRAPPVPIRTAPEGRGPQQVTEVPPSSQQRPRSSVVSALREAMHPMVRQRVAQSRSRDLHTHNSPGVARQFRCALPPANALSLR